MIDIRTGKEMTRGGFLKGILAAGVAPSIITSALAQGVSVGGMRRGLGARTAMMSGESSERELDYISFNRGAWTTIQYTPKFNSTQLELDVEYCGEYYNRIYNQIFSTRTTNANLAFSSNFPSNYNAAIHNWYGHKYNWDGQHAISYEFFTSFHKATQPFKVKYMWKAVANGDGKRGFVSYEMDDGEGMVYIASRYTEAFDNKDDIVFDNNGIYLFYQMTQNTPFTMYEVKFKRMRFYEANYLGSETRTLAMDLRPVSVDGIGYIKDFVTGSLYRNNSRSVDWILGPEKT